MHCATGPVGAESTNKSHEAFQQFRRDTHAQRPIEHPRHQNIRNLDFVGKYEAYPVHPKAVIDYLVEDSRFLRILAPTKSKITNILVPWNALSAFEACEYSRPKLVERLHEALLVDSAPNQGSRPQCILPATILDLCVTTNFEFLLERATKIFNRYCHSHHVKNQLSIDAKGPGISC